jgi:CheY-like chemotaxis protein
MTIQQRMKQIVLVVEDGHDTRVLLRETLEHLGYLVLSVANGKDALSILRDIKSPSVIILDINLPILDGDEFIEAIKQDQRHSKIPVIQISASITKKRDHAFCKIDKPFSIENLVSALGTCPGLLQREFC